MALPTLVQTAVARVHTGESMFLATIDTYRLGSARDKLAVDAWLTDNLSPIRTIADPHQRFAVLVREAVNRQL